MQADIRSRLTAAAQVLAFVQAHPDSDPSGAAIVAKLQDRVTQGDALAIQQRDGTADEHAANGQRAVVRRQMQQQLRHLAQVASEAVADHPEWKGSFTLTGRERTYKDVLTVAKSMLAAVTANQDALVGLGLGSAFVDSLTKAIATFDDTTTGAFGSRQDHIGARADLKAVVRDCSHLIRVLDGLNQVRFAGDPQLLAEWSSAANVVGGRGGRKRRAPAPTPEPAPAPAPAPAPVSEAVAQLRAEGGGVKG